MLQDSLWCRLITGDRCQFERSTDQGQSWETVGYFPASYEYDNDYVVDRVLTSILSVVMIDDRIGYAAGITHYSRYWEMFRHPVAFRTTDGGMSWQEASLPASADDEVHLIRRVFGPKLWLMQSISRFDLFESQRSKLRLTRDAAKTSRIYFDTLRIDSQSNSMPIVAVDVEDTSHTAFIASRYCAVTTDAGKTWVSTDTVAASIPVWDLSLLRSVGSGRWLAAGDSIILASTDRAMSWSVVGRSHGRLIDLQVHGEQAVALTDRGFAYFSNDSGNTWLASELSPKRRDCREVRFTPSGDLFCFGDTIWKFGRLSQVTPTGVLALPTHVSFQNVGRDSIATVTMPIRNIGQDTVRITGTLSDRPNFSLEVSAASIPPDSTAYIEVAYAPTSAQVEKAQLTIVTTTAINTISAQGNGLIGSLRLPITELDLGPILSGEKRLLYVQLVNVGTDSLNITDIQHSTNIESVIAGPRISMKSTYAEALLAAPSALGQYEDSILFVTDGIPPTGAIRFRYTVIESPSDVKHREAIVPGLLSGRPHIYDLSSTDTQITVVAREIKDSNIFINCYGYDKLLNTLWHQPFDEPGRSIVGLHSFEQSAILIHYNDDEIRHDRFALDGSSRTLSVDSSYTTGSFNASLSDRYLVTYGTTRSSHHTIYPYDYYDNGNAVAHLIDLAEETSSYFIHAGPSGYESRFSLINGRDNASAADVTSTGQMVVSGTVDTYYGWNDFSASPVYKPFFYDGGDPIKYDRLPGFSELMVDHLDRTIARNGNTLYRIVGDSAIDRSANVPAYELKLLRTGGIVAVGYVEGKVQLAKLNADLELEWSRHFASRTYDLGSPSVEVDRENNIYVGVSHDGMITLARYSPDGELEWLTRLGDSNTSYRLIDMALTPNASVIVGATRQTTTDTADVLVAFEDQLPPLPAAVESTRQASQSLKIYPNPVTTIARVLTSNPIRSVEVIDMLGRARQQPANLSIDATHLEPGTYIVKALMTDGRIEVVLFSKN